MESQYADSIYGAGIFIDIVKVTYVVIRYMNRTLFSLIIFFGRVNKCTSAFVITGVAYAIYFIVC